MWDAGWVEPFQVKRGITSKVSESAMSTATAPQPIRLPNFLFTCSPMIFLLFTRSIMQIRTTGSSMPLSTCDHMEIPISGAFGIRMMMPASIMIRV